MLVFKYRKADAAKFLPHLDVLRHMTRTFRRANLDVNFSQGFNPHMLINLPPPIPVGIESLSEYCFVSCAMKPRDFKKRYNAVAIDGLDCLDAVTVAKNPNVAGLSHSADYLLTMDDIVNRTSEVMDMLSNDTVNIEYYAKGGQVMADVKNLIIAAEMQRDGLLVRLRTGNVNLRADRLAFNLASRLDIAGSSVKIVKLRHFVLVGGKVLDVDKYLG